MILVVLLTLKLSLRSTLKNEFFKFFAKLFSLNTKNSKCKSCCNKQKTAVGISVLAASFCYCQECDLEFEGQILDLHDNTPISQATIQVIDSDQKVYSDDEGFFKFKKLIPQHGPQTQFQSQ